MFQDLDKACVLALGEGLRYAAWEYMRLKEGLCPDLDKDVDPQERADALDAALDAYDDATQFVFNQEGIGGPTMSVEMPNGEWLPVEMVSYAADGSVSVVPKPPTEEIFNR